MFRPRLSDVVCSTTILSFELTTQSSNYLNGWISTENYDYGRKKEHTYCNLMKIIPDVKLH